MKLITSMFVAMLAVFASVAHAGDLPGNFYVGADVGRSSYTSPGLTDTRATSYGVNGGYAYTKNLAVEASYADLGDVATGAVKTKANVTDLAAVGTYNISNAFAMYGRLGYAWADTDTAGATTRHDSVTYGAGVSYRLTDAIDLRGGMKRYGLSGSSHVTNLNAGLRYNFK